jgi:hypothetical protein
MAEIKYLADGIRLHIKEFFYKLKKVNFKDYFFFHFASIEDGLKAEKLLKNENIISIPVPNDIFKDCGVAILSKEKEKIKKILNKNEIDFEIYIYENNKAKKIEGEIKAKSCKIN